MHFSDLMIEFITFIASAGLFTGLSIRKQYVYYFVSEMHNYSANNSLDYCTEGSNTTAEQEDVVATETSRWQIYISLAGFPAIFTAIILTSWSDKIGRKIPLAFPLLGFAISNLMQLFIIMYSLPLYLLVISSFIYGLFGGFGAMININMAAISDITTKEQKMTRYTLLECSMGLGGGLASFACGVWITADGFVPSSCFIAACNCVAVLLVPFLPGKKLTKENVQHQNLSISNDDSNVLQDPCYHGKINGDNENCVAMKRDNKEMIHDKALSSGFSRLKLIWQVYSTEHSICNVCEKGSWKDQNDLCPHGGGLREGRVWRIWFYLFAFNTYLLPIFGTGMIDTMYFISYPLCFTPTYLGIRTAIVFGTIILAAVVVIFFKNVLKWRSGSIILQGICAVIVVFVVTAFARQAYLVFIAASFYLFSQVTSPVMRSQISSLASVSEQGSSLSLLSGTETCTNIIANLMYLLLYPATLSIYSSFIWLFSAVVLLIPLTLMIFVWIADKRKDTKSVSRSCNEDHAPLIFT